MALKYAVYKDFAVKFSVMVTFAELNFTFRWVTNYRHVCVTLHVQDLLSVCDSKGGSMSCARNYFCFVLIMDNVQKQRHFSDIPLLFYSTFLPY
jgi:hypothetical protein